MKSILIHAWTLHKKNNKYYIPYTHWVYLNEIVKYYDNVCLLSQINIVGEDKEMKYIYIDFDNVKVYDLPYGNSYINSIRYFFHYVRAYKTLSSSFDVVYARYPVPFGWLQKFYFNRKDRIIHYVGDPIDTAINNPNFSKLKKKLLIIFFKPENWFYNWACIGAKIFTNGNHLKERLQKKGILATALISSTLRNEDFFIEEYKTIDPENAKFIYLGNLRTAKGVETIIKAFKIYNIKFPNSMLKLIGSGEFEAQLRKLVNDEQIKNVHFLGRMDDRHIINKHLRESDVFLFASLSEGSPRVVLEAMANGLVVISTPVGSLPHMFEDGKSIIYARFNDPQFFAEKMYMVLQNNDFYNKVKNSSHYQIKEQTIENFIKKIFYEK